MRADRLLSLLMLLQSRGRMTAAQLAEELEVSIRTIYRDLTALSTAGVPVFAERGPRGGCGLLEEYHTSLTGLTPDEARALFMLNIPEPLQQLGLGQVLKSALLKLAASLPASRQQEETLSRQRIHLDSSWWFQSDEAVPCLATIQQAIFQDRWLHIHYRSSFDTEVEQVIEPYGLVAKANIWYLVYGRAQRARVLRVSQVLQAEILKKSITRPAGFDLAGFWEKWCTEYENNRLPFIVRVRAAPDLLPYLRHAFRRQATHLLDESTQTDSQGWVLLDLPFENLEAARTRLLGFGRAVEVLEPLALRKSIIDFAQQIADFYQSK